MCVARLGSQKRPSLSGRQLAGTSTAEAFHHNSVAATLESPPWQLLLSRVEAAVASRLYRSELGAAEARAALGE